MEQFLMGIIAMLSFVGALAGLISIYISLENKIKIQKLEEVHVFELSAAARHDKETAKETLKFKTEEISPGDNEEQKELLKNEKSVAL